MLGTTTYALVLGPTGIWEWIWRWGGTRLRRKPPSLRRSLQMEVRYPGVKRAPPPGLGMGNSCAPSMRSAWGTKKGHSEPKFQVLPPLPWIQAAPLLSCLLCSLAHALTPSFIHSFGQCFGHLPCARPCDLPLQTPLLICATIVGLRPISATQELCDIG